MNTITKTLSALAGLALVAGSAQAATVALTSVDQLDFTNNVKAYDLTGSNSIASFGSSFQIGGVDFTRFYWGAGTTSDNLTMDTAGQNNDNQNSGAPDIALGGTATDRTNLSRLLDVWNIGKQGASPGNDSVLTVDSLANGTYKVQYIVGTGGDRDNKVFYRPETGSDELLGSFDSGGAANYLITGEVEVTDGNLRLVLADGESASGDERRIISGLIISQVPEPGSLALLGLGGLLIGARRRRG